MSLNEARRIAVELGAEEVSRRNRAGTKWAHPESISSQSSSEIDNDEGTTIDRHSPELPEEQVRALFDVVVEDWKAYLADDSKSEDDDFDVHRAAWTLMYDHGRDPAVLKVMEQELRSADHVRRHLACKITWEATHHADEAVRDRAAKSLLEAARVEEHHGTLARLLNGLGYFRAPKAIPWLVTLVEHPSADVRDSLAGAIAASMEKADSAATEALCRLASDEEDEVRWSAVFEIGELVTDGRAHPRLLTLLRERADTDSFERIRSTASDALAEVVG